MKEKIPRSDINGIDVSGRFIPDANPNAAAPTFAEKVAQRAYLLYVDSGARHGHDVADWLLAEQQLRAQAASPSKEFSSRRGL